MVNAPSVQACTFFRTTRLDDQAQIAAVALFMASSMSLIVVNSSLYTFSSATVYDHCNRCKVCGILETGIMFPCLRKGYPFDFTRMVLAGRPQVKGGWDRDLAMIIPEDPCPICNPVHKGCLTGVGAYLLKRRSHCDELLF
jgi:hypothetical protein